MKNLKRVLSLGLASVMLLGMMVMGASAATFSDAKDIKNTEAVNMMTALNVITGKPDGSYDPEGKVTRGEMAKMITMILFGGEEATLTTSSTPKFSDVTTHWARKYIEYCAGEKQGIIAGMGDGTFAPDADVTGTAAAKMALVALGYDAAVYGFENNRDWDLNINTVANSKDANLYKGLKNLDPSQPITRDQAAQILFNALNAKIVEPTFTVTNNGIETEYKLSATETLLTSRFTIDDKTVGIMTKIEYDKDDEVYKYTIGASTVEFAEDVSDLFQQKVKVIQTEDKKTVLGIFAEGESVLASGIIADLAVGEDDNSARLKVGKNHYDLTTGTPGALKIYNAGATSTSATVSSHASCEPYWNVNVIDNTGDGKVDVIITYPVNVEQVKSVTRTAVTTTKTYRFEDHNITDGLAKDDYVFVTPAAVANAKVTIEKAEITTGTARAERTSGGKNQVQIDSTWYTKADGVTMTRGKDYDMVIVGNYVAVATESKDNTAANISDTVLVLGFEDAGSDTGLYAGKQEVKLLFTDGTEKIVTVDKLGGNAISSSNKISAVKNTLYSYKIDKDGNYELTAIKVDDFDGGSGALTNDAYSKGKVEATTDNGDTTFRFDNDAVVFVVAGDGKASSNGKTVKVVTGEAINDWKNSTFVSGTLYAEKANGFLYTTLGLINLGDVKIPGTASDTFYGMVVADAVRATDADKKEVVELTIWNGEETIEVVTYEDGYESTPLAAVQGLKAGDIISYNVESSTEVSSVAKPAFTSGAVQAYEPGKLDIQVKTTAANTVSALDKNATIIYFSKDGKDFEGVEAGEIRLADKALRTDGSEEPNAWIANVEYKTVDDTTEGLKTIDVIFVEVNNNFARTEGDVIGSKTPITSNPATSFSLSAATAEVKNDNKTATITVTITPNDADSNDTVTATSADENKVTAEVSGTTVTITLKDGYTAATPGTDETVTVSIKVGNLTAQDVTVTIKNS